MTFDFVVEDRSLWFKGSFHRGLGGTAVIGQ